MLALIKARELIYSTSLKSRAANLIIYAKSTKNKKHENIKTIQKYKEIFVPKWKWPTRMTASN